MGVARWLLGIRGWYGLHQAGGTNGCFGVHRWGDWEGCESKCRGGKWLCAWWLVPPVAPPAVLSPCPLCATGALKSYLRELPEPLMTFELYEEWIQASK